MNFYFHWGGGDGIADGACDCDGNVDAGCGCGADGPSGCDNQCGSTLINDECGICDGDNSSCSTSKENEFIVLFFRYKKLAKIISCKWFEKDSKEFFIFFHEIEIYFTWKVNTLSFII